MNDYGARFPTVTQEMVKEIIEEQERRDEEQAAYGRWLRLHGDRIWREENIRCAS